ncbi:MAG: MDR family MFS transporter [Syntrophobacteraceae bacterium]
MACVRKEIEVSRVAGVSIKLRRPQRCDIDSRAKAFLIIAALLALFLGALDALVVGAAMPTIVSDLGGLPLYSWVFSSYLLARAVSLPIFGKLCDLFSSRSLYLISIVIFIAGSLLAGIARNMEQLIVFRTIQGIGAGGTFALAYIVLSDLYPAEKRGKMMGLISFVWGISSILGPPVGGFIVAWLSWRWIFFINLPLGFLALIGIALYLTDVRQRKPGAAIDFLGALTLTISVTALLSLFLMAGRDYPWLSIETGMLFAVSAVAGACFCWAEKRAGEPILALEFFTRKQFSLANGAAFFSSFAIFSLSAFSPLFIQGVLGKDPAELGVAMVPLTLGWSLGAITCGQLVSAAREKAFSITGSLLLTAGTVLALVFSSPSVPVLLFSMLLAVAGVGMGFVSVPTLLLVQKSLTESDLGVATSSQQFARTLGGTIGIGISGGLLAGSMSTSLGLLLNSPLKESIAPLISESKSAHIEALLQPQVMAQLAPTLQDALRNSINDGVQTVLWSSLAASVISLIFCLLLPSHSKGGEGAAR